MIMLIVGIVLICCGLVGLIKPELMIGKANLNGTEEENKKKIRNIRILSIAGLVIGILSLLGKL